MSKSNTINRSLGLYVIQFPSGRWGYVGSIPVDIAYVDGATKEQIATGLSFGQQFGPKTRTFETEAQARDYAMASGHTVI